jgi:hypothetical protein
MPDNPSEKSKAQDQLGEAKKRLLRRRKDFDDF